MEFINRIEIMGIVGHAHTSDIAGVSVTRFSVATNRTFRNKDGETVIETTWHTCIANNVDTPLVSKVSKGNRVHVAGRVRNVRYTTSEGLDNSISEVYVEQFLPVPEDENEEDS